MDYSSRASSDSPTPEFLRFIFEPNDEPIPEGHQITVWNLTNKHTAVAATADDAATKIHSSGWSNVSYFGVCTRSGRALSLRARRENKPNHLVRGDAAECVGVPGLWVDIDVLDRESHQKTNLPPTLEAALDVAREAVPLPWTCEVMTGGGVHLYWLFPELIELSLDEHEKRDALELLNRKMQQVIRDAYAKKGWELDGTWDLARVLRPAGTMNIKKAGMPREVTWKITGDRYELDHVELHMPDDIEFTDGRRRASSGKLVQREDGEFTFDVSQPITDARASLLRQRVDIACEAVEEFALRWDRKTRGMKDTSQSAFDLSMATQLAAGGWSDQDIVDVLRMHRAANPKASQTKLHRADYYLSRLKVARASADQARKGADLERDLEEALDLAGISPHAIDPDSPRPVEPAEPAVLQGPGSAARPSAASDDEPDSEDTAEENVDSGGSQPQPWGEPGEPLAVMPVDEAKPSATSTAAGDQLDPEIRTKLLAALNKMLDLPANLGITRVFVLEDDLAGQFDYSVEFMNGQGSALRPGPQSNQGHSGLKQAVFQCTGKMIPPMKAEKFHPVAQAMWQLAERNQMLTGTALIAAALATWIGRNVHEVDLAVPMSTEWYDCAADGDTPLLLRVPGKQTAKWLPTKSGVLVRRSRFLATTWQSAQLADTANIGTALGQLIQRTRSSMMRDISVSLPVKRLGGGTTPRGELVFVSLAWLRSINEPAAIALNASLDTAADGVNKAIEGDESKRAARRGEE
tara:strand:+ start:5903 stop:8155 length:2253 start_codon:yes stop_codon:yes gene_type:complete